MKNLKNRIDAIRREWNYQCQFIKGAKPIASNRCAYVTETWRIVDRVLGICICEFIASDLFYLDVIGVRYWDYLERRKYYIVRAMGLNPDEFEIK